MKHLLLPFLSALALQLASCATKRPTVVSMIPLSAPVTTLPSEGIESVRYTENLKAYPLGRYIDPSNRQIMHEGHTVYRVETTAKWNLHPNQPAAIPLGPTVSVRDPAKTQGPLGNELAMEINRQKETTRTVIQGQQVVSTKLGELTTAMQQSRQAVEQSAQLQGEVSAAKQRLDVLEAELRTKQDAAPTATPKRGEEPKGEQPW